MDAAKEGTHVTRNAAVRAPDGLQRVHPLGAWSLLTLALAGLSACARPAADPAPAIPKEKPAMTAPGSALPATPEQAGDAAASASDRAAGQAPQAAPRVPASVAARPLPQGPALETQDLRARVLKLVAGLRTAHDTEASAVAKALDVPFGPDPEDPSHHVVEGRLGSGGRYFITVGSAGRDTLGKEVEVRFIPEGWKGDPRLPENALPTCSLDFSPLNDDLAKLGYSGEQSPPYLKEFWSYRKDWPANNITFYLVVNLYRATGGDQAKGRPCVLSIEISADDAEVDHG
ncbi:hypothetical protein [Lysobacter enzymogenes]|uniref:hypothetical protein n=1 Tax=Lysobacter enzymogenes TaxID=69 RepID=UPI001A96EC90|nr:hypothetical protein [Lysobacter enzymogenes]QQP97970.1 hypothetical protein JHW38_08190 [Lysobacter enzymogenes]